MSKNFDKLVLWLDKLGRAKAYTLLAIVIGVISAVSIYSASKNVVMDVEDPSPTILANACDVSCKQAKLYELAGSADSPARDLAEFNEWLTANNAKVLIGEYGWPNDQSSKYDPNWDAQAKAWVDVANESDMMTTIWATGSNWSNDYALSVYYDSNGDKVLDMAHSQANIIDKLITSNPKMHGINLAGLEFGTQESGFSNTNSGAEGTNYFLENERSFAYLADAGIRLVRLPINWERLQPQPYGELDETYLGYILESLNSAQTYQIDVILDLHNYAEYSTASSTLRLGSRQLPVAALSDVWTKLIEAGIVAHSAVSILDIMNEPQGIAAAGGQTEAQVWEAITQEVLTSIRDAGSDKTVAIPGYEWSDLTDWTDNHPDGWITDPASNFIYTAHHYWDEGQRGQY